LNEVASLLKIASAIAELDALLSLSDVAVEYNYVRPKIGKTVKHIKIENGRHPVVEKIVGARNYIANDTLLDDGCKTMIITGPNMSGKSTYMRQVALITLLAHIGSFVPASSAEISLTDRIFTRIGASDDLAYSQSTFMVEMVEVATILNNATQNSLLILDEIGRGTSTYDGLGIAWAVMETVVKKLKAKTLFATHYHELTDLESRLPGVKNYRVLANEVGGSVVFLHKIARGEASKSFGAEVAALAGVSADVVSRAKDITKILEETSKYRDTNQILMQGEVKKEDVVQSDMFESQTNEKYQRLVEELTAIDMNSISPMQAFSILADLVSRVK
ncbi:MAG: DNA mismatch repair protein MutS, partial [Clostridia bacterium]|nr:DNA mismatch repair protein MutS [Clostridia bacterium]